MTHDEKTIQTEPFLFREPDKKIIKFRWAWPLGLLSAIFFYLFLGTFNTKGIGTLKARKYVKLQTEVPGVLKQIIHKKGEVVYAAQVVAKFENDALAKDLMRKRKLFEISEEKLKQIEENEKHLKVKNERASILFENGVIGKSELDEVSLKFIEAQKEARLNVRRKESLQREVAYLEREVAKLDLKTPIAGVLLNDPTEKISNHFNRGDEVFEIGDPSTFYVEMPVRENKIERIHRGDYASVWFDALPSKKYSGTVTEVGVKTNLEVEKVFKVKHVVICEIKLDEDTSGLRYGMQARVLIHGGVKGILGIKKTLIEKGESYFDGTFKS